MKYRRYTREFKEAACKLGADPACGPGQAAKRLGIPETTLRLWMNERGLFEDSPMPKVPETDDPNALKAQIRQLQEQLRESQVDNEILKKAAAYFARNQP